VLCSFDSRDVSDSGRAHQAMERLGGPGLSRKPPRVHTSANPLVSRTAHLRAPATQPMKEIDWEGRGNPFAALSVGFGAS
jgi:hypothetical protein